MRRLLAGALVAVTALVVLAVPASAHAQLKSTDPAGGSQLTAPPKAVTIAFGESVEASLGSIRVYDAAGTRLDVGRPTHPGGHGSQVTAALPTLDDGSYVVTWRVISADSHPVHGAFTFRVGSGTAGVDEQALATRLLNADGGSTTVGGAYAVVRFLAFAALVVLVGGVAFLAFVWPVGRTDRRARRVIGTGWVVLLVATAVGIGLQGAYGGGLGLGDALRASVYRDVLDTRFGHAWLARVVLLVLALPLLRVLATRTTERMPTWWLGAAGVVGAGLVLTPGLGGHAATGDLVALAVPADALHVGAAAVWLGGLAILTICVLPRGEADELRLTVPRFSAIAFWSVAVIVATGTFQAWRQVGSIDALTTTTYGRLLIVKVCVVAALVALAWLSRRETQRRWLGRQASPRRLVAQPVGAAVADDGHAGVVRRLRWSVGAEAVAAIAVLAVTALLVNSPPAKSVVARPFSTELRTSSVLFDIVVDPARAGRTDIHVYTLSPAGDVKQVDEITGQLTLASKAIGPLAIPLRRAGPGHFLANGFDIPIAGTWQLAVTARTGEFDQAQARTTVTIR